MSHLQVVLAATALAALVWSAAAQRTIRPQDVDRILSNDRLLTSYINCVLDKTPCTTDGRELRKTIPQALSTGCATCSANQRVLTERVIRHLRLKRPRDWTKLTAKYDPKGDFERRYSSTPPPATTPAGRAKTPRSAPKPTASTEAKGKPGGGATTAATVPATSAGRAAGAKAAA